MSYQVNQDTIPCGINIREGVQPDPKKLHALIEMPPPTNKNKLKSFLGIVNYPGKFLPSIAEVCEPLTKLISPKFKLTPNNMYLNLYDRAKNIYQEECNHGVLQ